MPAGRLRVAFVPANVIGPGGVVVLVFERVFVFRANATSHTLVWPCPWGCMVQGWMSRRVDGCLSVTGARPALATLGTVVIWRHRWCGGIADNGYVNHDADMVIERSFRRFGPRGCDVLQAG